MAASLLGLLALGISLGGAVAGAAPAAQQQAESEPPEPQQRVYETATVTARPIDSSTAAVSVLDRDAIEALAARSAADVLRFAPGVQLLTDGSRGGATAAQIRGGDPNFTLVLLDGVPLNDTNDQQGGAFSLNSLPTAAIERIEVVSGPLSSHFGSTGLAGAINIITRGGAGRSNASANRPAAHVAVETGSASLARASAGVSNWRSGHDYAATLQYEREEGRIGDDRFEQFDAQTRLGLRPSATSSLRFVGRFATWEADDYPVSSGGPDLGSGEIRSSSNDELSLGADLTLEPSERRQYRIQASVYRHALERNSPAIFPLVPPSVEDARFTRIRGGASALFRGAPIGGSEGSFLSVGLDVTSERGDVTSVFSLPAFFGGDVSGDYEMTRTFGGPYAELVWELDAWIVELGTRLDFAGDTDAQLSPRLGIARRIGPSTRIRASAGRAFKLPSFFALASPRALGGNPDLLPETSWGGDLAVQQEWRESGVTLSIGAFYNRFNNLIDFDFDTFQNVNRNVVETRGLEAGLGWRASDRFRLDASATYQDVEDPSTPEPLLQRPEWLWSLRGSWRPHDRALVALDAEHVGAFFDRQLPVPDRDRVERRTLLGLTGSWEAAPQLSLIARVDNLGDTTYESLIGFPGPSRSVRVGLRYDGR